MKNKNMNTKKLTTLGVLAACSIVLVAFIHFPIFPAVSFLEYDPADIPILIGTFLFGPVWGVVLTVLVSAIQGMTVSAQSGVYGIVMHIIATSAFTLVAGTIYKRKKTKKDVPPDLKAVQLLLATENEGDISLLSDDELEKERQRLLTALSDAEKDTVDKGEKTVKKTTKKTVKKGEKTATKAAVGRKTRAKPRKRVVK